MQKLRLRGNGTQRVPGPQLPERPATKLRSVPGFAQMGTVPFSPRGPSAASVLMPRAKTELTELLAGDAVVCVRPQAAFTIAQQAPAEASVAAASAAVATDAVADADLARLIEVWPSLPRNIRAAIAAMVRETSV